jgi:NDP-sugar pyrophosphorylase family protein
MFTGIHVLEPAAVARLPDDGAERCIVRQGYVPWLAAGERIEAFEHTGTFLEHSTPERYLAGNLAVLRGQAAIPYPPGVLTGVDPTAEVHPTARIIAPVRIGPHAVISAGATVGPDTVIGARARVAPGVTVERSILWPHAAATVTTRDTVLKA